MPQLQIGFYASSRNLQKWATINTPPFILIHSLILSVYTGPRLLDTRPTRIDVVEVVITVAIKSKGIAKAMLLPHEQRTSLSNTSLKYPFVLTRYVYKKRNNSMFSKDVVSQQELLYLKGVLCVVYEEHRYFHPPLGPVFGECYQLHPFSTALPWSAKSR